METERRHFDIWCGARRLWLTGAHIVRSIAIALVLLCLAVRAAAHFVIVPYQWIPARWDRSPLSRASLRLAHLAADAVLVVVPIALVLALVW